MPITDTDRLDFIQQNAIGLSSAWRSWHVTQCVDGSDKLLVQSLGPDGNDVRKAIDTAMLRIKPTNEDR